VEQLTVFGPRDLKWADVPEPTLQGDLDAIVRPIAVATCDMDVQLVNQTAPPFPAPLALGHEFIADVVTTGPLVRVLHPGLRVAVPFQISCGACDRCQRGLTSSCRSVPLNSQFGFGSARGDWGGALSDLVRVPFADAMCVLLPAGLDPAAVASAGDNLGDAWRAVAPQLACRPHVPVLIVGGLWDTIGLYTADMALALGADHVVYCDRRVDQLRLADELGARTVDTSHGYPTQKLGDYPITVDASGDAVGLRCALRSTEPGGHSTLTSIFWQNEVALPLRELYVAGITMLTSRVNARACLEPVLELARGGAIHPERLTHQVAAWSDAAAVLAAHTRKTVIVRDQP